MHLRRPPPRAMELLPEPSPPANYASNRCCCLQAALPVHHELRRAPIRPSLNRQDAASTRRHPSFSNRVCAAPPSFAFVHSFGVDYGRVPGVTWIRQGRQDPRPFGVALFWNAKYHDARSPRIHQVQQRLCTTTSDAEHLRIVYNYFRYGRVQLLPLRPVNDYFPRRF